MRGLLTHREVVFVVCTYWKFISYFSNIWNMTSLCVSDISACEKMTSLCVSTRTCIRMCICIYMWVYMCIYIQQEMIARNDVHSTLLLLLKNSYHTHAHSLSLSPSLSLTHTHFTTRAHSLILFTYTYITYTYITYTYITYTYIIYTYIHMQLCSCGFWRFLLGSNGYVCVCVCVCMHECVFVHVCPNGFV